MLLTGVAECDHLDVSVPLDTGMSVQAALSNTGRVCITSQLSTGMSVQAALSELGGVTITYASFHESTLRVMIGSAFSDGNGDGPLHHTAGVTFGTDGGGGAIWSCSSMGLPSATISTCTCAPDAFGRVGATHVC